MYIHYDFIEIIVNNEIEHWSISLHLQVEELVRKSQINPFHLQPTNISLADLCILNINS
jgi:hypothetical protein